MKYQKILGLVATAGLLLAGCATDSDNSNTWLSDPNAVHVSASVGSIFTRSNPAASDEAGQKSFNTGDVMGVSNNAHRSPIPTIKAPTTGSQVVEVIWYGMLATSLSSAGILLLAKIPTAKAISRKTRAMQRRLQNQII